MALNSVNTNVGAQIALQNLQVTNNELSQVQSRINTGKKISSAKDNGAIWAIAQSQRAEVGALNAVKDSLNRGQQVTVVSDGANWQVVDASSYGLNGGGFFMGTNPNNRGWPPANAPAPTTPVVHTPPTLPALPILAHKGKSTPRPDGSRGHKHTKTQPQTAPLLL